MLAVCAAINDDLKGPCIKSVNKYPNTYNSWQIESSSQQVIIELCVVNIKRTQHYDNGAYAKK